MDNFVLLFEDDLSDMIGERVFMTDSSQSQDPLRSVKLVIDIKENQI